ncbi:MaoC/PaaZ C-terminal domain-containing protein [Pseudooceanicola sp. MF1-13]|uniref:MaoC/PaaZ C-terminal domain-containing protein n=1 Tax=Pseudooceanicola sp. MF1-13 TaxID=3379095 RepID=UPI003891AA48
MTLQTDIHLPGADLPVIEKTLTAVDLMAYGAATWDWYACHFNDAAAQALGVDAPFVDGQMWGAWFGRQLRAHCGPQAFVQSMKLRYHAMCFAGDTVICRGRVESGAPISAGHVLTIRQSIEKDGKPVASAVSMVLLPAENPSSSPATEGSDS